MSPRILILSALAALTPIFAFGGAWGETIEAVWLPIELDWADDINHQFNLGLAVLTIEAEPVPPRPEWCDETGMVRQPSLLQCDDYDEELTGWLMDFVGANDPAGVAHIEYPPTYCGGC